RFLTNGADQRMFVTRGKPSADPVAADFEPLWPVVQCVVRSCMNAARSWRLSDHHLKYPAVARARRGSLGLFEPRAELQLRRLRESRHLATLLLSQRLPLL